MRAHRGQLAFGEGPGEEVFAASFLTRREVVLDEDLVRHAPDLVNIFTHEIYHFVWRRLSNAVRQEWMDLLGAEKTRLHTGLSSRLRFEEFQQKPTDRHWKNYVCEAFTDTAAALGDPTRIVSSQRRKWFANLMKQRKLPV